MRLWRKLAYHFADNLVIRNLARVIDKGLWVISRSWSHCRYRALLPHGGDSSVHWSTEIKYPKNIFIGNDVSVGPGCCLGALSRIEIGDYVRVSRGVIIETAGLDLHQPPPYPHVSKPVKIGNGAWIGSNAIILGGVTIGEGAIVGAGTVISKDVAPRTCVIGPWNRVLDMPSRRALTPEKKG